MAAALPSFGGSAHAETSRLQLQGPCCPRSRRETSQLNAALNMQLHYAAAMRPQGPKESLRNDEAEPRALSRTCRRRATSL